MNWPENVTSCIPKGGGIRRPLPPRRPAQDRSLIGSVIFPDFLIQTLLVGNSLGTAKASLSVRMTCMTESLRAGIGMIERLTTRSAGQAQSRWRLKCCGATFDKCVLLLETLDHVKMAASRSLQPIHLLATSCPYPWEGQSGPSLCRK